MTDNLTPQQRRRCMSHNRGSDTSPERRLRSALHHRGYRFRKHCVDLPGRPDVVFRSARVAVFVDGDFWHGYRLPAWEHKLSPFWQTKIRRNRERDRATFQRLRRNGWTVLRLWEHELLDLQSCVMRIERAVEKAETHPRGSGRRLK